MKSLILITLLTLTSCAMLEEPAPAGDIEKAGNWSERFLDCYDRVYYTNANHKQSQEVCALAVGKRQ